MAPFIKEYTDAEKLGQDINQLSRQGIDKSDMHVFSYDSTENKEIKEWDLGITADRIVHEKGNKLCNKLRETGFTDEQISYYKDRMEKGSILLVIKDHKDPDSLLGAF